MGNLNRNGFLYWFVAHIGKLDKLVAVNRKLVRASLVAFFALWIPMLLAYINGWLLVLILPSGILGLSYLIYVCIEVFSKVRKK